MLKVICDESLEDAAWQIKTQDTNHDTFIKFDPLVNNTVSGFRGRKGINKVAELVPEPEQIVCAYVLFYKGYKVLRGIASVENEHGIEQIHPAFGLDCLHMAFCEKTFIYAERLELCIDNPLIQHVEGNTGYGGWGRSVLPHSAILRTKLFAIGQWDF